MVTVDATDDFLGGVRPHRDRFDGYSSLEHEGDGGVLHVVGRDPFVRYPSISQDVGKPVFHILDGLASVGDHVLGVFLRQCQKRPQAKVRGYRYLRAALVP